MTSERLSAQDDDSGMCRSGVDCMRDTIWLYFDYMGESQAERTDYGLLREPQVEIGQLIFLVRISIA